MPLDSLEEDSKIYIKGLRLMNKVSLDYQTVKHTGFIVDGDDSTHSVMYFSEKLGEKRWQCDCKWYTLHNKTCSHIIAVNIAIGRKLIDLSEDSTAQA